MTNEEILKAFKKELPRFAFLTAFGCTAAVTKKANKAIEPFVVRNLQ